MATYLTYNLKLGPSICMCPEIYCLRLIDEYCENYAEILCVIVYCLGMCLRQNSGQGV